MKMKNISRIFPQLMLSALLALSLSSCEEKNDPAPNPGPPTEGGEIEKPFTAIPDEFVGTWYADHNENPLTINWEQGTFQGESGFREFRTMVLTKDGQNAVEYTTSVHNLTDEVKHYFYKITGTLEYKTNPTSLTFHAQSGKMRVYSSKSTGYKESDIVKKDMEAYATVFQNPSATTFTSSTNFLDAKRLDGAIPVSVKYKKVDKNTPTTPQNPADLYATPPASGTYVKMGSHYYPTVSIGTQEWMAVNYAGPGGIKNATKPHYGTFIKYLDLKDIPVPAGWRLPTKQDYIKLIRSQGIAYSEVWESTDGDDLESKKLLGNLMATTGWLKQDGFTIKYHANGETIWSKGKILNNQPDGYWEWYRIDGTKKRSGHFDQGEPAGEWVTYDKEGKVYKVTKK
jgi:uncharacterized protein (TIGR02145 family)